MAKDIFVPKMGQTVEAVTLINWLVEDGEKVERGQEILEIETDKAIFSVEASASGYVHKGAYEEGDVVPVLAVVGIIGEEDETFEEVAERAQKEAEPEKPTEVAPETPERPRTVAEPAARGDGAKRSEERARVFASPRARKLAEAEGVDLSQIAPTGGEGRRVVEQDVINYLEAAPKVTPVAQKLASEAGVDVREVTGTGPGGKITRSDVERRLGAQAGPVAPELALTPAEADVIERIPLTGVRGVTAERMGHSAQTTARVTLGMEVDATDFVELRTRLKARVEDEWGFAPGYTDLLAKVVAAALRQHPYMNARLTEDRIERLANVNLGLAVDTERGLLVPVIRNADRKSVREIGTEFRAMVDRAREGRSTLDDLSGGTFTITNLGMYDVDFFTPIINPPEAAILGVGRLAPKAVPRQGEIVVRQMWTLSLAFDHRITDGAPAARFLRYIKERTEEPYLLWAE